MLTLGIICRNDQRNRSQVLLWWNSRRIFRIEHTGFTRDLFTFTMGISPDRRNRPNDVRIKGMGDSISGWLIRGSYSSYQYNLEGGRRQMYLNQLLLPGVLNITRLGTRVTIRHRIGIR